MDSTCPTISIYSTNSFLKLMFSVQITIAILAIIGILCTWRKTFSSILLDSAFKEHLICCYTVHILQSLSIISSMGLFLFLHIIQPPCLATISSTFCFYLRFSVTFSIFSLPFLNLTLAVFRVLSFFGGSRVSRRREITVRRLLTSTAILICGLEFYWKLEDAVIEQTQVAYCKSFASKANTESLMTGIIEIITLISSTLLMYLYERENRINRSFNISVNLTRRQLISTMRLFLPYSVFHACTFLAFTLIGPVTRELLVNVAEPYFSAISGFTFCPMYFTMISPWIIHWIVKRNEKNRTKKTSNLINLEEKARTVYFENYRSQWGHTDAFLWKKNNNPLINYYWKLKRFPFFAKVSISR